MVLGISNTVLTVALVSILLGAGSTALYYRRVALKVEKEVRDFEEQAADAMDDTGAGYGVELDPPNVGRNVFDVFKVWLHVRKQARLAKRGYLKWYRVSSRLHKPTWIKPEKKGAGEYEYYHKGDDQTYLFPEDALVTDGVTSAYTAIHKVGEAEPIDLRDPGWASMDADRVQEVIDLLVNRDPPGGLSKLPLNSTQLKWIGIGLLGVVIFFAQQMFIGGGA